MRANASAALVFVASLFEGAVKFAYVTSAGRPAKGVVPWQLAHSVVSICCTPFGSTSAKQVPPLELPPVADNPPVAVTPPAPELALAPEPALLPTLPLEAAPPVPLSPAPPALAPASAANGSEPLLAMPVQPNNGTKIAQAT